MLSGHRSARRPRRNSRSARIAVSLAIPMALGLTLGIVIAVSGAGRAMTIEQSALGACASAAADVNGAASGRTSPLSYPTLGGPENPGPSSRSGASLSGVENQLVRVLHPRLRLASPVITLASS